jgi:hypothetical protein
LLTIGGIKTMKNKVLIFFVSLIILFSSIAILANANLMKISNNNNPPNPPVINGPSSGKIKNFYTYDATVSDPDEEDLILRIEINFSDGTTACGGCDGRGPWHSGEVVEFEHSWTQTGTFGITGRVKDEHGVWSEWSEPLSVSMPKTKINFNLVLQKIFMLLPNIYKIK